MGYLVTLKNEMKYVIEKNFSCKKDELLNEIFIELRQKKKVKTIDEIRYFQSYRDIDAAKMIAKLNNVNVKKMSMN